MENAAENEKILDTIPFKWIKISNKRTDFHGTFPVIMLFPTRFY